jgi:hypothetical protein
MHGRIDTSLRAVALSDDPVERAWAEAYRGAALLCDWWPHEVYARLEHAIRQAGRTAGRVGPKAHGQTWPATKSDWEDLLAQVQGGEKFQHELKVRLGPSHAEVSAEEAALRWPIQYLAGHDGARRVLMVWMRCKANHKPFRRVVTKVIGCSGRTTLRRQLQAALIIATGLIRDGVRIDEETQWRRIAGGPAEGED